MTRYGRVGFLVMPFGLCNAAPSVMTLMSDVLRPYLDHFVLVYLEGVLISSKIPEDHL